MSTNLLKKLTKVSLWIGLIDSLYLSYIKLAHKEAICSGIGQCDVVQASSYSLLFGIPIAVLGALAYIILLYLLFAESKVGFFEDYALMISFGMTFVGFLYSLYLTYIEIEVLNAICPYCVVSAIAIMIAFIATTIRLNRYMAE